MNLAGIDLGSIHTHDVIEGDSTSGIHVYGKVVEIRRREDGRPYAFGIVGCQSWDVVPSHYVLANDVAAHTVVERV